MHEGTNQVERDRIGGRGIRVRGAGVEKGPLARFVLLTFVTHASSAGRCTATVMAVMGKAGKARANSDSPLI